MEQVIYADVLFAVNFSMDFLSLYITSKIGQTRPRAWPMIFAATIGALYATAAVFAETGGAAGVVINVAVAWLMCYVCFGGGGAAYVIGRTLLFYGVGFLLGGVMTAFYGLLGSLGGRIGSRTAVINGDLATLTGSTPLPTLILLAGIAALLCLVFGRLYDRKKSVKTAELEIAFGGCSISVEALCDSGNLVRDPLSGLPVIFICAKKLRELIPLPLADVLISGSTEAAAALEGELARKICVISLSGIKEKSIVPGLRADSVTVNGIRKSACICCTGEASYGGRDCLVPSSLL